MRLTARIVGLKGRKLMVPQGSSWSYGVWDPCMQEEFNCSRSISRSALLTDAFDGALEMSEELFHVMNGTVTRGELEKLQRLYGRL